MVSQLQPATLLLNWGHWRLNGNSSVAPWPAAEAAELLAAAADAVAPQQGAAFWKTTTAGGGGRVRRELDAEALAAAGPVGVGALDAWRLTEALRQVGAPLFQSDGTHLQAWVYAEQNQVLLGALCPAGGGPASDGGAVE